MKTTADMIEGAKRAGVLSAAITTVLFALLGTYAHSGTPWQFNVYAFAVSSLTVFTIIGFLGGCLFANRAFKATNRSSREVIAFYAYLKELHITYLNTKISTFYCRVTQIASIFILMVHGHFVIASFIVVSLCIGLFLVKVAEEFKENPDIEMILLENSNA